MLIIYGGTQRQVRRQLECGHSWYGPCIDEVSRFNKCLACFALERDFATEEEYYEAVDATQKV